jgi:RNA polymerase-binding transcription factor DksA
MNERLSELLKHQRKPETHRMKSFKFETKIHCERCGVPIPRVHHAENKNVKLCQKCSGRRSGLLHSRRVKWRHRVSVEISSSSQ